MHMLLKMALSMHLQTADFALLVIVLYMKSQQDILPLLWIRSILDFCRRLVLIYLLSARIYLLKRLFAMINLFLRKRDLLDHCLDLLLIKDISNSMSLSNTANNIQVLRYPVRIGKRCTRGRSQSNPCSRQHSSR
jgi:hypothetical protein